MLTLKTVFLPLLSSLLLLLSSCSTISPGTESPEIRAERLIENGEYKMTLDLLTRTCSHSADRELPIDCSMNLEQVMRIAEQSYESKDFAKAGALYQTLIQSGINSQAPSETVSFTTARLRRKLGECSKILTREGLLRYREEKIDEAISIWERILSFDPENKPVKKAIETADKQRRRLKNID